MYGTQLASSKSCSVLLLLASLASACSSGPVDASDSEIARLNVAISPANPRGPRGVPNYFQELIDVLTSVAHELEVLDSDIGTLGPPLVSVLDSVNGEFDRANDQIAEALPYVQSIATSFASATNSWSDTNGSLRTFASQWSTTNKVISDVLEPTTLFVDSVAIGAGLVVGNLAVKGGMWLGQKAYSRAHEAIWHTKQNAQDLHEYVEAKDNYRPTRKGAAALEARINSYLAGAELIGQGGSREAQIRQLGASAWHLQRVRDRANEVAAKIIKESARPQSGLRLSLADQLSEIRATEGSRATQYEALANLAAELDDMHERIVALRDAVRSAGTSICTTLVEDMDELRTAEAQLQTMRETLLDPDKRSRWQRQWADGAKRDIAGAAKMNSKAAAESLATLESESSRLFLEAVLANDPELYSLVETGFDRCLLDSPTCGMAAIPCVGRLFWRTRADCWKQATDPNSIYATTVGYSEQLSRAISASSTLAAGAEETRAMINTETTTQPLAVNLDLIAGAHRVSKAFIRQLRAEQSEDRTGALNSRLDGLEARIDACCNRAISGPARAQPPARVMSSSRAARVRDRELRNLTAFGDDDEDDPLLDESDRSD